MISRVFYLKKFRTMNEPRVNSDIIFKFLTNKFSSNSINSDVQWNGKNSAILQNLKLELELWHSDGHKICNPEDVAEEQWKYIATLRTQRARFREFKYIGKKHWWKISNMEKKNKWKIQNEVYMENQRNNRRTEEHIIYGLSHTTVFPKIYDASLARLRNNRLWLAKELNNPKIIFDCSYDQFMNKTALRSLARQIVRSFSENRKNVLPFDLYLCSANSEHIMMHELNSLMINLVKAPLEIHSECFSKVHPKESFVYLTPYSKNLLQIEDLCDTLVVGGVIDKGFYGPITQAKAKELNIRTAWLPINLKHYKGVGETTLPLDIITRILLEFKHSRDWNKALEHLPPRLVNRANSQNSDPDFDAVHVCTDRILPVSRGHKVHNPPTNNLKFDEISAKNVEKKK